MSVSHLPYQSTAFIGRDHELSTIAAQLADPMCRLLTLVGPGGIGKTRLALQAVLDQIHKFTDGVYFVSLTPVGSMTFIASAIASALQLSFYGQEEPDVQVVNYLCGKHMLLVMDNYEHLLGGIGLLTHLLANAPQLKFLVTSRERLNMQEEWILPVEGLNFPIPGTNDNVGSYSAVQLFMQMARRIQPDFRLNTNEASVADICRAVEGMPLGIELAATWLRAMPSSQIAEQIRRDLDFLTTPLRNVPERHRSLRAVFEHSWGLLYEDERDVVMKLSVFRGGIGPEGAAQIAGTTLRMLAGLVDKSFVRLNPAGRFEMHELLRQFAADKLLEAGHADETRHHHLRFFLELAKQLEQELFGPQCVAALDCYEIEHDNFRAALDWAWRIEKAELGLGLAGALGWFWYIRDFWQEGREWLDKFLAADNDTPIQVRAKAVFHTLELSASLQDEKNVAAFSAEALTLTREVQNPRLAAWLLSSLGHSLKWVTNSQTEVRQAYLEEALTLFRQHGDNFGICETDCRLALECFATGDFVRAGKLLEEGIGLARQANDKSILSWLLLWSSVKNLHQGMTDRQTARNLQESLAMFGELRHKKGVVIVLYFSGKSAHLMGEDEQATMLFSKSLMLGQQIGLKWTIAQCLTNLAAIYCVYGEPERGARLLGAVNDLAQILFAGSGNIAKDGRMDTERSLTACRAGLGEEAFAVAFAEGQMMTLDQGIAYALAHASKEQATWSLEEPLRERQWELLREFTAEENEHTPQVKQSLPDPLTPRELEILRQMSAGLTNQEIADQLVISVSTVKKHITHIYNKLGASDRIKVINRARELDLLPYSTP